MFVEAAEAETDASFASLEKEIREGVTKIAQSSSQSLSKGIHNAIRDKLTELRASIRSLEEFAEEQDSEEDATRLLMKASNQKQIYERFQTDLRRAILQVRRNAEEMAINERKALMGSPEARQQRQRLQSEAELAGVSEGITASLQRTRQQMAQELEHTAATLAAMDVSDETLTDARNEFQSQKASHKRSHQLLGTMRRHSILDWLTLWGGVSMFMLVVLYIVTKRSVYFIPGFAKNMVLAPFRSRNGTTFLLENNTAVHKQDWSQDFGDNGKIPDYENHFGSDEVFPADQEEADVLDLRTSLDANAGLRESDLAKASATLEEAYKEASASHMAQAISAYPGSSEQHLQAQAASTAIPSPYNDSTLGLKLNLSQVENNSSSGSAAKDEEQGNSTQQSAVNSSSLVNMTGTTEGIADDPLGTAHALPTNTAAPDARPHQSQPELENTDASRRSGQEFHESAESASLGHQSSNSFAPLIEDGKDVADEQTSTVASPKEDRLEQSMAATSLSAPDASKVEGDQAELTNDTSNNGSAAQMQAEGTGDGSFSSIHEPSKTSPLDADKEVPAPVLHAEAAAPFSRISALEDDVTETDSTSTPTSSLQNLRKEEDSGLNQSQAEVDLAAGKAVLGLSANTAWDEADLDYQEPVSETTTQLDKDAWSDKGKERSTGKVEQTTRQEDTELGIFRPGEL